MGFPCQGCEKRKSCCHMTCKEYLECKAERDRMNQDRAKKIEAEPAYGIRVKRSKWKAIRERKK